VKRLLLLKAAIPGGADGDLFPGTIQVKAHTRKDGHQVKAHTAARLLLRKDPPAVPEAALPPPPPPPAPPPPPEDDAKLLEGLPAGTKFVRGRGVLNSKNWRAELPDGVPSNYFPTKEEARKDALTWWINHHYNLAEKAVREAHQAFVAKKLRAGETLTDSDVTGLGLRAGKKASFEELSPLVQTLFGISKARVRTAMGDALEKRHTDGGTVYWVASPRAALANAAAWATPPSKSRLAATT
jgi:hypothetical protein